MDIPYSTRSKFLDACEAAVREKSAELRTGSIVRVHLQEGGYDGRVIVNIWTTSRSAFGTDWERTDRTRFPTRITAAATALLNCHCEGRFEISHSQGDLTIRAI
jgi:hypothetical protein